MKTVTCPVCSTERQVRREYEWAIRTGKSPGLCRPCSMAALHNPGRVERFWARVDKTDTCWLWTGGMANKDGYGTFKGDLGRDVPAHRFAYELLVGAIPEGLELDHLCRVRHCVNPTHLEPVTRHENWRRGQSFSAGNALKTHCPKGHAYTEDNTYILPSGSRVCRTCKRDNGREWARQKRAAHRTVEEHREVHERDVFALPREATA